MKRGRTWLTHASVLLLGLALGGLLQALELPYRVASEASSVAESCGQEGSAQPEQLESAVRADLARSVDAHFRQLQEQLQTLHTQAPSSVTARAPAEQPPADSDHPSDERIAQSRLALDDAHTQLAEAVERGVWTMEDEIAFLERAGEMTEEDVGEILTARTFAINEGHLDFQPP